MMESKFFKVGLSVLAFIFIMAIVISGNGGGEKRASVSKMGEVDKKMSVSEVSEAVVGVCVNDNDSGEQKVGSGVAVDEDGYIITSSAVAGNMHSSIVVTFADGRKISASCVWKNDVYDIALIKADCRIENTAQLGDAKNMRLGDRVYALGASPGVQYQRTVSEGVISGMYTTMAGEMNGESILIEDLIQTDAAVTVNCRGGGLVNSDGEVIGVIVVNSNGNFAVPANIVSPVIKRAAEGEEVREIMLGMYCYDGEMAQYLSQDFGKNTGVTIACITDGGIAEKSGLMLGDMITCVNGRKINTMLEFYEVVNSAEANDVITFDILRGGKSIKIKIITAQLR